MFCFNDSAETVAFGNSHEIALKFVSDNDTAGLGFLITVMQQSCPHIGQCGQVLFSSHRFAITSPDYPLAYKNNKNCKYVIIKQNPRICKLRLIVRSFDVEYQAHCDSDYLQLADGNRLCGYQEPGQISELNDKLITGSLINCLNCSRANLSRRSARDGVREQLRVHARRFLRGRLPDRLRPSPNSSRQTFQPHFTLNFVVFCAFKVNSIQLAISAQLFSPFRLDIVTTSLIVKSRIKRQFTKHIA